MNEKHPVSLYWRHGMVLHIGAFSIIANNLDSTNRLLSPNFAVIYKRVNYDILWL